MNKYILLRMHISLNLAFLMTRWKMNSDLSLCHVRATTMTTTTTTECIAIFRHVLLLTDLHAMANEQNAVAHISFHFDVHVLITVVNVILKFG